VTGRTESLYTLTHPFVISVDRRSCRIRPPFVSHFSSALWIFTPFLLNTESTCPSTIHAMPLQIAVIGAGIAGLSAAVGLRRAGHDVVVSVPYALHRQTNLSDIRTIPFQKRSRRCNCHLTQWHSCPQSMGLRLRQSRCCRYLSSKSQTLS
jgi:hypothetical protein